ncbi:hypothetical protein CHS0354_018208 [Potamilus streckersoni]|uniref:Uncharacterized protein n=1 Tax=Potamilus streckersoni TaxID=2493646 RepID=A0AAE0RUA1_9BIVA|nr:hypothetical protein CHS0354_018208 [Potamilus streckersoni]
MFKPAAQRQSLIGDLGVTSVQTVCVDISYITQSPDGHCPSTFVCMQKRRTNTISEPNVYIILKFWNYLCKSNFPWSLYVAIMKRSLINVSLQVELSLVTVCGYYEEILDKCISASRTFPGHCMWLL